MDLTQTLEIATCTDPGMVRSHNEDSIAADPANGLVVLADGMGGYNAGEVASGMATTVIVTEMRQILANARPYEVDQKNNEEIAARLVRDQVLKANTSIFQASQSQPQYAGMGTTLVVCLFYDNRILVAHLGDSRLYMSRDGKFKQVTRDPALFGWLVRHGGRRRHRHDALHARRKSQARRPAARADGQRQRGSRQRFGYTGPGPQGVPGRQGRHGQGVRVVKITSR